jgi:23S rRNA pseudouridine1911/1915/1917 synthase
MVIQNATRKIQNAATEGNIFVNDAIVKSNYKVKAFDVVRVMLTSSLRIILLLRIFR